MAATIREAILTRLVWGTLVFVYTGTPVPHTFRSRKTGVAKAEGPVIVVVPVSESVERYSHAGDRHDLDVEVQLVMRGDPWDSLADQWASAIHSMIFADAILLSYVTNCRATDTLWTDEEADRTAGVLSMRFRFTYLSSAYDLTRAVNP